MPEMQTNDRIAVHVLDRMRALCSRREYCTDDIRKKIVSALSKAGLPEGDANGTLEHILSELKKDRYIDDLRYATAFARDKAAISGWGEAKIRYALSAKRVDRDMINEALCGIDAGRASERLEKLLANKYRSLKPDPSRRMKLLRFAMGRGYSYEDASAVISKLSE